jgi:ABC transporter DrrB family efflux protein
MTAATTAAVGGQVRRRQPVLDSLSDTWALLDRHMRHLLRTPQKLIGVTVMPVAYVALFGVLFGSAVKAPGGHYQDYLMAGILAQTMLTNISNTALGIASDLGNGLVDRFRSLPMSHTAVLVGRTTSNMVLVTLSIVVMSLVGLLIGWHIDNGLGNAVAGFAMLLLLGFVMAWLGALLGLIIRDAEAINSVAFVVVLPLTFLSNAFIPLSGLPAWLRVICEWNPMSSVVYATRQLFGNPVEPPSGSFPTRHPLAIALIVLIGLLVVLVPLAVRAYRRVVTK